MKKAAIWTDLLVGTLELTAGDNKVNGAGNGPAPYFFEPAMALEDSTAFDRAIWAAKISVRTGPEGLLQRRQGNRII